jgi:hypothetical protein
VSLPSEAEYRRFISGYSVYKQVIGQYSEEFDGRMLIYYRAMLNNAGQQFPEEATGFLSNYEPYDGKVSLDEFLRLCMARYGQFAERASRTQEINIFESSYLQNQVNELLLFHCLSKGRIIEHLKKLAECYEELQPVLIYLSQADVRKTILRVADERRLPDREKYPWWIDHIIRYISESNYGKKHALNGFDGVVEYFKRRKEIELEAVNQLDIRTAIVDNSDYSLEKAVKQAIAAIS